MERTLPSPTSANNVYFKSRWTEFSLSLSLCLCYLFKGVAQKSWILCAQTTSLFLGTLDEISGNTLRKHTSAEVMGFRCGGLGRLCNLAANNYRHSHNLHQDYQKVAVLQTVVSSGWNKLKWEKDLPEKSLSALWMIDSIDSCALTSSLNI